MARWPDVACGKMSTEDTGASGAPAGPRIPGGPGGPEGPAAAVPAPVGPPRATRTDYKGRVIELQASLLEEAKNRATSAERAERRATSAERRASAAELQVSELQARVASAEHRPLEPQVEQETNQVNATIARFTEVTDRALKVANALVDKIPPRRIFDVFAFSHGSLSGGLDIGTNRIVMSSGPTTRVTGTHPPLSSNGDLRSRQLAATDTFLRRVPLNDTFMDSRDELYPEAVISGTLAVLDENKLVQKWFHAVLWPLISFMEKCGEKHYLHGVYDIGKCVHSKSA